MATETTAWGRWDCTRCGQKEISGRDKRCPSCGDPREQHELDAMRPPSDADFEQAAIVALEELAEAKDGPDWSCGYCGSNNRASHSICQSCGGDREQKLGPRPAPTEAPPKRGRRRIAAVLAAGGVGIAGLATYGYVDHDIEGKVSRLEWSHVTEVQRWQDVTSGDWQSAVRPRAAVAPRAGAGEVAGVAVTGCRSKHHHDESYACGTESYSTTESYTCGSTQSCSTRSNGNGSFSRSCTSVPRSCTRTVQRTRTRYCSRPIYAQWCDYVTQSWLHARHETVAGEGHTGLRFAELAPQGDLERVVKHASYAVTFSYGDEGATHREEIERGAYDGWQLDEPVVVTVERFGGVVGVRRPDAPR